jgi:hypothetical protein
MRAWLAIGFVAGPLAWAPLASQEDCCVAKVNLGFSTELMRGAPPFEGIEGLGPECDASGGIIEHVVPGGPQRLYMNVISSIGDPGGVQGWVVVVALTGAGDFVSATTAGTAADGKESGGLYTDGFNRTEVLHPGLVAEGKGAMTAVVLSLTTGTTLPLQSTESVLALEVSGPDEGTSELKLTNRVRGGQPIINIVTLDGASVNACNQNTVAIRIRHIASRSFLRGNANADARLDIGDPVWILNDLFHDGRPSPCGDAADSNDDGRLDISDAVHLIRYLFLTGAAPPLPFPECGLDLTEDEIDCVGESEAC